MERNCCTAPSQRRIESPFIAPLATSKSILQTRPPSFLVPLRLTISIQQHSNVLRPIPKPCLCVEENTAQLGSDPNLEFAFHCIYVQRQCLRSQLRGCFDQIFSVCCVEYAILLAELFNQCRVHTAANAT